MYVFIHIYVYMYAHILAHAYTVFATCLCAVHPICLFTQIHIHVDTPLCVCAYICISTHLFINA